MEIGENTIEFFDCFEVCQGGPEACRVLVNGRLIQDEKFDPSPLLVNGGILLPMRRNSFFKSGYVLTKIDPSSGSLKVISKVHAYMRLRRIIENTVEFWTNAWEGETATLPLP